jgi:hypothetical protein
VKALESRPALGAIQRGETTAARWTQAVREAPPRMARVGASQSMYGSLSYPTYGLAQRAHTTVARPLEKIAQLYCEIAYPLYKNAQLYCCDGGSREDSNLHAMIAPPLQIFALFNDHACCLAQRARTMIAYPLYKNAQLYLRSR